jgi:hypothetical protein
MRLAFVVAVNGSYYDNSAPRAVLITVTPDANPVGPPQVKSGGNP